MKDVLYWMQLYLFEQWSKAALGQHVTWMELCYIVPVATRFSSVINAA